MFAKKKIIAVLALAMLPVMTCQASWMRQEGEVGASIGVGVGDSGSFFDRNGTMRRNTCGTAWNMPLYGEYGASYYRTYYASTSLSTYNCGGAAGQLSGFTDFELGMRGRMDLVRSDHTWEAALIIPSYVNPTAGNVRQEKNWGIKLGFHSNDRVDPYQSFITGELPSDNVFSYGAGAKLWVGHIPDELFGYLGWGHIISKPDWTNEKGGWHFSARLDGKTSFTKEHTVIPGNLQVDPHDKFSLLSGQVGLSHNLTQLSSIHFSLHQGLWGKNIGSPSSLNVSYSKTWRD